MDPATATRRPCDPDLPSGRVVQGNVLLLILASSSGCRTWAGGNGGNENRRNCSTRRVATSEGSFVPCGRG